MVQWLGLHTFTAEGLGSVPGRRTKTLQVRGAAKKKKIALFTIAKIWKLPKCPSRDGWIKKMSYVYGVYGSRILLSHKKE